ncbi:MAG: lipoprotein, partial [Candidatus Aminicenantes bacterium]|nr:lipoprotein [Candidatus Aminicenantes bacterium]
MKKLIGYYLFLIMLLWILCGCGIKGPLIAPVIKLPQKITEMKIVQRGENLILNWKNPETYTDGSPLTDIDSIEIWMLDEKIEDEETDEKITKDRFLGEASLLVAVTPAELMSAAKNQDKIKAEKGEEEKAAGKLVKEKKVEEKEIPETAAVEEQLTPEKYEYRHKLSLDEIKKKKYSFALRVKDEKDKYSDFT